MKKQVRVGFGVYIIKGGKVLLGKRIGNHGKSFWSAPGGHLEYGESWEEGARRETLEEAGIKIKNIRFAGLTNDIHKSERKHYVTIAMLADYDSGEVKIMEPEKLERWEWFKWDKLPRLLFLPMRNLLKQKFNPFEKYYGVSKRKKS
ncbi:MAG: DNA mismatch repair protein MutT [Candidatus Moranbacteria bacterium RBG_13_45_13]|nr:MAG: DNA mismatch repair protein MutT [Candidatus Moranbacteria bacterium RBG_13_45_13]